jgi:hypothetical protein
MKLPDAFFSGRRNPAPETLVVTRLFRAMVVPTGAMSTAIRAFDRESRSFVDDRVESHGPATVINRTPEGDIARPAPLLGKAPTFPECLLGSHRGFAHALCNLLIPGDVDGSAAFRGCSLRRRVELVMSKLEEDTRDDRIALLTRLCNASVAGRLDEVLGLGPSCPLPGWPRVFLTKDCPFLREYGMDSLRGSTEEPCCHTIPHSLIGYLLEDGDIRTTLEGALEIYALINSRENVAIKAKACNDRDQALDWQILRACRSGAPEVLSDDAASRAERQWTLAQRLGLPQRLLEQMRVRFRLLHRRPLNKRSGPRWILHR